MLAEMLKSSDVDVAVRWIIGLSAVIILLFPIVKVWIWIAGIFSKYATVETVRARTDALESRILALEKSNVSAEEDRMHKMAEKMAQMESLLQKVLHKKKWEE